MPDGSPRAFAATAQWNGIAIGVCLVAVTIAVYWPALRAGFIWDDDVHVTANPCVVGPLGFKEIWTTSSAVYYPLVLTSFWVQHAIWGLNPFWFHLVNILMHGACAVLLWRVLLALKVSAAPWGAALWALHPVQVESVAWITELKNTQSGCFYLLAILCFLNWLGSRSDGERRVAPAWYWLSLLSAILAILSKSSTAMLPVVLGLCWWWRERSWRWRDAAWLAPFLLVSTAAGLWTIWEQKFHSGAQGPEWSLDVITRLIVAGKAVWFYVGKLVWPHPLIFIYPRWDVDHFGMISLLPGIMVVSVWVSLWVMRSRSLVRPLFFAFSCFLVSLFPVMGFFDVYFFRYSFVGDHFQYLASMSMLALLAAGAGRVLTRRILLPTLIAIGYALLSWQQTSIYADVTTLWRDTVAKNPSAWLAHNNLAVILTARGELAEAVQQCEQAIEAKPDFADAYTNKAIALAAAGKLEEAARSCERAIELKPGFAEAHYNLGAALAGQGKFADSLQHYERALELKPTYAQAASNLGVALFRQGRVGEAVERYQLALRLKPAYAEAEYNLALALAAQRRVDEAVQHYEAAIRLRPDYAEAEFNLAVLLTARRDTAAAIQHYERALEIKGDSIQAMNNLGYLLATTDATQFREPERGLRLCERANQLASGNDPIVLGTLAAVYASQKRYSAAIATLEQAVNRARSRGDSVLQSSLEAQLARYNDMVEGVSR